MAHVIVEPSRHYSFALARASNNQNAYDGSVGIYWPAGNVRTVFSLDRYKTPSHLSTAVANMVRRSLVNCRSTSACSWDFLQEHISQNKLEELRSTGSKKLDDYVEAFDAEIKAKDDRIENLRQENGRLCAEIQRLEAVAETKQNSVLSFGQEQPLYAGEFQDALLKILKAGKGQVVSGGRYEDIVESILSATHPVNKGTEIQAEIKRILSGSKNIGRGETRELEQLGFIVNDQGKHLNITFHGDPRYSFTTAKTGSDGRGLKNFLSDVNKKLFM
jgi:hypothetical protein